MNYRRLDPEQIIATIAQLEARIDERFPGAGLGKLVEQLRHTAQATVERIRWIKRPHVPLRIGIGLLLAAAPVPLVLKIASSRVDFDQQTLSEFLGTLEATLSATVLIGAAILFLVTFESRIKRDRALQAVHELRAMAHIVDMHQLTKDPESVRHGEQPTRSSPKRVMTPFQLGRYLDYCSEALSLIAKVSALYAQQFGDAVVLAAVDEVEGLTSTLSNKIWQKLSILEQQARG